MYLPVIYSIVYSFSVKSEFGTKPPSLYVSLTGILSWDPSCFKLFSLLKLDGLLLGVYRVIWVDFYDIVSLILIFLLNREK